MARFSRPSSPSLVFVFAPLKRLLESTRHSSCASNDTQMTSRTATLAISFIGILTNAILLLQVVSAQLPKWDSENEWESVADPWRVNGVKILWAFLSTYFLFALSACFIGLVGTLKNIPSYVRFYRDYSIADFSFCAFLTVCGFYTLLRQGTRSGVCEVLSRQPQLMRDAAEFGLNLENCEMWVERASMACAGAMMLVTVIRLHFLIAVSNFYSQLQHRLSPGHLPLHSLSHSRSSSSSSHHPHRIYLLPPTVANGTHYPPSEPLVYTPVPLSSLSDQQRAAAQETWVSSLLSSPSSHHHHHHGRHGMHHRQETGRIRLHVEPNEPLMTPSHDLERKEF